MRLDIGWRDIASGFGFCVMPIKRSIAEKRAKDSWSRGDDFLITLSVRSAFDLMLRALQLPPGSEVLLSALTVPDMVRIVKLHELVPVPVDTDEAGNIISDSLKRAISPQTRMIVIAHLFGGSAPLDEVHKVAKDHDLLVVEDCAQSFLRPGDSGHPESDAALFSFGPIKTASALGGAVARIKSPELRERMAGLLESDSIQSRKSFALRIARFSVLKLLSGNFMAEFTRCCVERFGGDFDSMSNSAARGFSSAELLKQLRRQPSTPLLRLMERRWQNYDFTRIDRRMRMGRLLDTKIGIKRGAFHSYWVYPIFVRDPIAVCERLCAAGFDATCQARMTVVPAIDDARKAVSACSRWEHAVFLPWYPDMPFEALDDMIDLLSESDIRKGGI
ncbi:MAG: DegT/DnrJ/EryC1/StrS family aminotransferase [Akkermansiaceae bacterium]|nr:DegT/DnrJ/EryC1/StrS family aminotransferase [Akkermansiaceae bacterium]MDP4845901.1 DegT/DnrJ/EryC1/StrS family aminotransferase [Akkermansiaceae bacterium]MDP4994850.1 DegT/DnrJ/EryC1/StrS family aminotransferase [Akkermansiaceae bacterium]